MLKKISHIGIAVNNLDENIQLYRDVMGMEFMGIEEVAEQKVRVAMFKIGESRIELLEPTSEDSPVAKFLASRGEGMHHLCYEVDDVDASLKHLDGKGVRLIDKQSRLGAENAKVGFIHPKSTGGVLVELNSPAD
ncbi:MAG TPA: methylmalonyl-CoA epimerase [Bacteroidetes bacterium]|nr:methylmalonyl-CoA epimerase [Bacteroidota bacterium]HEX04179.1 methylmalonyl-CoA epimerase [Bacteroidota bacterium]